MLIKPFKLNNVPVLQRLVDLNTGYTHFEFSTVGRDRKTMKLITRHGNASHRLRKLD